MRLYRSRAALVLSFALGCGRAASTPETPGAHANAPTNPSDGVDASAHAESVAASSAPVGIARFTPPPAAAIAKNDRGVALLAQGNAAGAAGELEQALSVAPEFLRARYNLACARARSGDFARARAELELVFEADFVGTRAHADSDPDLAEFWKSAPGKALTARVPELESRYRPILERGLHAILWRDGPARGPFKPALARAGVYDTVTNRFVPVMPATAKTFYAYASSRLPLALAATGDVRERLGGDLDAGMKIDQLFVYPISTRGAPIVALPVNAEPYHGTLTLGAQDLTLDVCQAGNSIDGSPNSDKYCLWFDLHLGDAPTRKLHAPTARPTPRMPTRERPISAEIGYNHWGYATYETDPAYAYSPFELALPSGAKIAVPKTLAFNRAPTRAIVASPAGDRVVLVWNGAVLVCDPSQDVPGRFKMALFERATGKLSSLGEGDGAGAAAFRADGELFVQRGRRVYHVAAGGAEDALPEGILLVPPLARDDQCGF